MGDQRRRSKSGGCQKEQEEGEERVGMCVQVYTEWVWPLFTVHSRERGGGVEGWGYEDGGGGGGGGRMCGNRIKEAEQIKNMKEAKDR